MKLYYKVLRPIPVAARSKLWVCGRLFAGIVGSIPAGAWCLSVVSVVCCQVQVSATGRSLVQRSPTECGVSECDRESSIMSRPWPNGLLGHGEKKYYWNLLMWLYMQTVLWICILWAWIRQHFIETCCQNKLYIVYSNIFLKVTNFSLLRTTDCEGRHDN
jgi:hypothetical protein